MNVKVTTIKDLGVALRDLEPYLKNGNSIRMGGEFTNFPLRPRELLGLWLLCVVGNANHGKDILTFSNDPSGSDGCIVDKTTQTIYPVEQTYVSPIPKPPSSKTVEDLIIGAINKKIKKGGKQYAKGKFLAVLSDVIGPWYPNRVAKQIAGKHDFEQVWAMALKEGDVNVYKYNVALLDLVDGNSPCWEVIIHFPSRKWIVRRFQ